MDAITILGMTAAVALSLVISMAIYGLISLPVLLFLGHVRKHLEKTTWSPNLKLTLFVLLAVSLAMPVVFPVATISGFLGPNIYLIGYCIYQGASLQEVIGYYWHFGWILGPMATCSAIAAWYYYVRADRPRVSRHPDQTQ